MCEDDLNQTPQEELFERLRRDPLNIVEDKIRLEYSPENMYLSDIIIDCGWDRIEFIRERSKKFNLSVDEVNTLIELYGNGRI